MLFVDYPGAIDAAIEAEDYERLRLLVAGLFINFELGMNDFPQVNLRLSPIEQVEPEPDLVLQVYKEIDGEDVLFLEWEDDRHKVRRMLGLAEDFYEE